MVARTAGMLGTAALASSEIHLLRSARSVQQVQISPHGDSVRAAGGVTDSEHTPVRLHQDGGASLRADSEEPSEASSHTGPFTALVEQMLAGDFEIDEDNVQTLESDMPDENMPEKQKQIEEQLDDILAWLKSDEIKMLRIDPNKARADCIRPSMNAVLPQPVVKATPSGGYELAFKQCWLQEAQAIQVVSDSSAKCLSNGAADLWLEYKEGDLTTLLVGVQSLGQLQYNTLLAIEESVGRIRKKTMAWVNENMPSAETRYRYGDMMRLYQKLQVESVQARTKHRDHIKFMDFKIKKINEMQTLLDKLALGKIEEVKADISKLQKQKTSFGGDKEGAAGGGEEQRLSEEAQVPPEIPISEESMDAEGQEAAAKEDLIVGVGFVTMLVLGICLWCRSRKPKGQGQPMLIDREGKILPWVADAAARGATFADGLGHRSSDDESDDGKKGKKKKKKKAKKGERKDGTDEAEAGTADGAAQDDADGAAPTETPAAPKKKPPKKQGFFSRWFGWGAAPEETPDEADEDDLKEITIYQLEDGTYVDENGDEVDYEPGEEEVEGEDEAADGAAAEEGDTASPEDPDAGRIDIRNVGRPDEEDDEDFGIAAPPAPPPEPRAERPEDFDASLAA